MSAILVFAAWHLAALNSLSLYAGHGFSNLRSVLASRDHLIGLGFFAISITVILGSQALDLFDYGIFVGIFLLVIDAVFLYRAVRSVRPG